MQVDERCSVAAGGEAESELRGCAIHAVELLRQALAARHGHIDTTGAKPSGAPAAAGRQQRRRGWALCQRRRKDDRAEQPAAVHLDWWLWEQGERRRAQDAPHHRTLTIYY